MARPKGIVEAPVEDRKAATQRPLTLWREVDVTMTFTNRVMAGVPRDPDMIRPWLEARAASDASHSRRVAAGETPTAIETLVEEVTEEVADAPDRGDQITLVFKREDGHLFVESYTIKAHLKDSCKVLGEDLLKANVTALRSKVANRVYVHPEHIPILKNGQPVSDGDGFFQHPVHVVTMQGPRSSLKANEYVEGAELQFTLRVLRDRVVTDDLLRWLFEYGAEHGYGAERGLNYGKYAFTLRPRE